MLNHVPRDKQLQGVFDRFDARHPEAAHAARQQQRDELVSMQADFWKGLGRPQDSQAEHALPASTDTAPSAAHQPGAVPDEWTLLVHGANAAPNGESLSPPKGILRRLGTTAVAGVIKRVRRRLGAAPRVQQNRISTGLEPIALAVEDGTIINPSNGMPAEATKGHSTAPHLDSGVTVGSHSKGQVGIADFIALRPMLDGQPRSIPGRRPRPLIPQQRRETRNPSATGTPDHWTFTPTDPQAAPRDWFVPPAKLDYTMTQDDVARTLRARRGSPTTRFTRRGEANSVAPFGSPESDRRLADPGK